MDTSLFPTKGNLIAAKRSLSLANIGFELMDKKRHILIREFMSLLDEAKKIQGEINETFSSAYISLQNSNVTFGLSYEIAMNIPEEEGLDLKSHSVMGVELPILSISEKENRLPYGLFVSNSMLDDAYQSFIRVKNLCVRLAQVESSVYRLALEIKKTQKRANALKSIVIPRFNSNIKKISDVLEEKEREEFIRLKVIKKKKV